MAIMVFPPPGGPTKSRLCIPLAAISAARRAIFCPLILIKSNAGCSFSFGFDKAPSSGTTPSLKKAITSRIWDTPTIVAFVIKAASSVFSFGTTQICFFCSTAQITMGSIPLIGKMSPFKPSSPATNTSVLFVSLISPMAPKRETATGRSNPLPLFLKSAGSILTVIRLTGR